MADDEPAKAAPFESFDALRREHGELRRWLRDARSGDARESAPAKLRHFLRRTAATGAVLSEPGERNGAQAILDYWCSELVGLPDPQTGDFRRLRLADASQAAGAPTAAERTSVPDARDVIRLAATARLWRDSGRKGFLLTGDALDYASGFQGVDADIDELVHASRKARRKIRIAGVSGSLAIVLLLLFIFLAPTLSERAILAMKSGLLDRSATARNQLFHLLSRYQPLHGPFDLSGLRTRDVDASGLKLASPNFSEAVLRSADFSQAALVNAAFKDAKIMDGSTFEGADLSLAQFGKSGISDTSFAGANLYRTLFDRSCFRQTDFSGANLRQASFWGVSFDEGFAFDRNFRNAPWWLSDGWNSRQIDALSKASQDEVRATGEFEMHLDLARQAATDAEAGSTRQGRNVNELAWRYAIWGAVPASGAVPTTPEPPCDPAAGRREAQEDPLRVSEQAICLFKLKAKEQADSETKQAENEMTQAEKQEKQAENERRHAENEADLANSQDTKAYLLLQMGRVEDAADIYRREVMPHRAEDGGALFRAAVAHQAIGDGATALSLLERSDRTRYVPTHEMYTLKAYIDGGFRDAVYRQIDRLRPSIDCEPGTSVP